MLISLSLRPLDASILIDCSLPVALSAAGLANEQIDDESDGTAYHIPEGCFIVYDPQDTSVKNSRIHGISTTAILPSFLQHFGLPIPEYMSDVRIDAITK